MSFNWIQGYEAGKPVISIVDNKTKKELCRFSDREKAFEVLRKLNRKASSC